MEAERWSAARRLVVTEDEVQAAIRSRAEQSGAATAVPEIGALLRLLAEISEVRHAVEVGSAGGVTGGWLMAGMGSKGVLTTIEADSHQHTLASAAYADLGINDRVRAILGDPATVLGRLSDDQYDLIVLQANGASAFLDEAERLLRNGGTLVLRGGITGSGDADPALEAIGSSEVWSGTVLPLDGGLVLARLSKD